MGDLLLTIYVCTYVRTYVVRTYRKMSRSGMLIGMLRVSCRPIDLLRGLDGAKTTTLRGAPGLAELEQLHMKSNSRHLFIPQLHNNLA